MLLMHQYFQWVNNISWYGCSSIFASYWINSSILNLCRSVFVFCLLCFCAGFLSYLRALPTQNHFKFNSLLHSFLDGERRAIRFSGYSGVSCYNYELSGGNSWSLPLTSVFSTNTTQVHMRVSSYAVRLGKDLHSRVPASLCSHQHDSPRAPRHGQAYLV